MTTDGRRNRATRSDMSQREAKALEFVSKADHPVSMKEVQDFLGLSYPTTAALIQRLVADRDLDIVGRNRRAYLLSPPKRERSAADFLQTNGSDRRVIEPDPTQAPPFTKAKEQPKPVRELGSVSSSAILNQLHIGLGGELTVAGFHMVEGELPVLDLKSADGEVLSVTVLTTA